MKKYAFFMAAALLTTACDVTITTACDLKEPIVSDFNENSVKVTTSSLDSIEYQRQTAGAEASRICGKVGKKAEYVSTTANPDTDQSINLYLCL